MTTYKFAITIKNTKGTITRQKGVDIEDLGALIQDLKKAIASDDGAYCTMYEISNHGYTPNFITNSKKQYENFISVHQNIEERPFEDLRNRELKYAKTIRSVLKEGSFLESFNTTAKRAKPIAKIIPSKINKSVDSYSVVTSVVGIISEMGSRDFRRRPHVYLDGFDYKIYTSTNQDEQLREYYRKRAITLKVKLRKSIISNRIISASLLDIFPKSAGKLIENLESLSNDDLSFIKNIDTHEDILKLRRV